MFLGGQTVKLGKSSSEMERVSVGGHQSGKIENVHFGKEIHFIFFLV